MANVYIVTRGLDPRVSGRRREIAGLSPAMTKERQKDAVLHPSERFRP